MTTSRSTRKRFGDRVEVLVTAGWRCWFCGDEIGAGTSTVAHLRPPTQGGSAADGNLCAACVTCCSRKGGKSVEEFRAHIRRRRFSEVALANDLRRMAADHQGLVGAEHLQNLLRVAEDLDRAAPPVTFHGESEPGSLTT